MSRTVTARFMMLSDGRWSMSGGSDELSAGHTHDTVNSDALDNPANAECPVRFHCGTVEFQLPDFAEPTITGTVVK